MKHGSHVYCINCPFQNNLHEKYSGFLLYCLNLFSKLITIFNNFNLYLSFPFNIYIHSMNWYVVLLILNK